MPVYSFRCPNAHCEDIFLNVQARNYPRKCKTCQKKMTRMFSAFGIKGENHAHQLYSFEQKYWEDQTGQKFQSAGELDQWCKDNGKTVIDPSTFQTKKPQDFSDREALKALDKVYDNNHDLGAVK